MKNFVFAFWVIFFPVSVKLADYLLFLTRGSIPWAAEPNDWAWFIVTALYLGAWGGIGYLLYEKQQPDAAPGGKKSSALGLPTSAS